MTAALPPEAAGKPVEIWFTDEARVGQQGTLTRVWAKRGSRPRAPRDRRYEWAYLFGAVCPERSTGAAIVMPEVVNAARKLPKCAGVKFPTSLLDRSDFGEDCHGARSRQGTCAGAPAASGFIP